MAAFRSTTVTDVSAAGGSAESRNTECHALQRPDDPIPSMPIEPPAPERTLDSMIPGSRMLSGGQITTSFDSTLTDANIDAVQPIRRWSIAGIG
jgi:hypothetical protein